MMTLCNTCKQANTTCPVYPMNTENCVEYKPNAGTERLCKYPDIYGLEPIEQFLVDRWHSASGDFDKEWAWEEIANHIHGALLYSIWMRQVPHDEELKFMWHIALRRRDMARDKRWGIV